VTITLHHANDKAPIEFVEAQIFYIRYSAAQKATLIVSVGGAYAPVSESVDEVKSLLGQKKSEKDKE
jgi:hypothetical protein